MTKILITGGAGFIGSHIVEKLIKDNFEVIVIDNLSTGKIDNLPKDNKIKLYQQNIFEDNINNIFDKERPEYVIHLAAQTSVFLSGKDPVFDANINILASLKLLQLCKQYNIKKIIAASTAAVYGIPKKLPISENHPTIPISFYGLSKLTMEKYIKLSEVPYIIFRFSNVYGPRQYSSKESGVVSIFDNAMKKNLDINIYGDGEQIRDFIYVKDIANVVCSSIKNNIENEIINYSTNKGITINKLFYLMKELYGYKKEPIYLRERIGDIKDSILSNEKSHYLLNCTKYTPIEEGLINLKEYSLSFCNSGGRHD